MPKKSEVETKTSYDKMSKWYDALAGRFERKYREQGLQKLDAKIGEKILEIGLGTGNCVVALAHSVGTSGRVYGIDLSAGMLRIALSRIKAEGITEKVTLLRGDAVYLPFKAACFDAILLIFTLELFDNQAIPGVLHECQRILRHRGRICVAALSKKKMVNVITRLYEWSHKKFPQYIDCRPIFIQQSLADTGFDVLDITEMSAWGLPIDIVLAKKP